MKRELPTWREMDPSSQLVTVLGQQKYDQENIKELTNLWIHMSTSSPTSVVQSEATRLQAVENYSHPAL